MTREGAETPKPGSAEHTKGHQESNKGPALRDRLFVAGQVLGVGTLVALGGLYATKHEDSGIGSFLNQDEPKNERVTTGQLFADSPANVEQGKVTYQDRLN